MAAVMMTGVLAAGVVVLGVTLAMRGPSPVRRTELAAPGVRPAVLVAAAQLRKSSLLRVGSMSSREGPVPSALTGQGSVSSYLTESMVAPVLSLRLTVSPPLDR